MHFTELELVDFSITLDSFTTDRVKLQYTNTTATLRLRNANVVYATMVYTTA